MSHRRRLIPAELQDPQKWPRPNVALRDVGYQLLYNRRCLAIEMYARNESFEKITYETSRARMGNPSLPQLGISRDEVNRLIKRALLPDGRGGIVGFYAALPRFRAKPYKRRAASTNDPIRGRRGGLSGSFTALIEQIPELQRLIKKEVFGKGLMPETRPSIRTVHQHVLNFLRDELRFTDHQYPFNVRSEGYESLRKYVNALIVVNESGWVKTQSGKDAATRLAVGTGHEPILPVLRPFEFGQLDYHKVDAISRIKIATEWGEIAVLVKRWHICAVADEHSHAITGAHISLEYEPSTDDFLSTLQNSIIPPAKEPRLLQFLVTADGCYLPNQTDPLLAFQCFSVLSVDGALCNISNESVNVVVDLCGGVLKVSGPGQWYSRWLMERIFLEFTARGIQRFPNTTGSHPRDPKREDADEKTIEFDVSLHDIIDCALASVRRWNHTMTAGILYSAPIESLRKSLDSPTSKYIPAPLPIERQLDSRIMYHAHQCRIAGSKKHGKRPYVECHGAIFRSVELAQEWNLIGEEAVLYVNRLDIRDGGHLVLTDGSRQFLQMRPDRRWLKSMASWRDLCLIHKYGKLKRQHSLPPDPIDDFFANKRRELEVETLAGRKARVLALQLARRQRQEDMASASSAQNRPDHSGGNAENPDHAATYPKRPGFDD